MAGVNPSDEYTPTNAGVAELVIPPDSKLIGKSPRDLLLRKTTGLSLLAIYRGEEILSHVETEDHRPTAIGLVAAIPAVIFYNKFSADAARLNARLEAFADEFAAIVSRQIDHSSRG